MEDITRGKVPTAFLSSTCYDLKQIRTDIKKFFEENLGFDIFLSEYTSFPVNPETTAVDSCLEAVKKYADLFILVVGGRYGYVTDKGKSVTNLEYLTAREKHIPIYVFIDKKVLNIMGIWKSNPNADFSSVVDSNKVFEFIDSLRNKENIWVYEFEFAQDIILTLKRQIAYLFLDMLRVKKQIDTAKNITLLEEYKGEMLRLLLEKPIAWEYKIFGQAYEEGLKKLQNLKRDYKYGISIQRSKRLADFQEIVNWILEKTNDFSVIADNLGILINENLPEALGKPGEPADIEYVIYVANKIVELYEKILNIGLEVKNLAVDDEFKNLVKFPLEICDSILEDIESYCKMYQDTMKTIKKDEKRMIKLTFDMRMPNLTEFYEELDKVKSLYGLD